MILVDTSAWIEWLVGSPAGIAVGQALPPNEAWLVPTIVQLELAKSLGPVAYAGKVDEVITYSGTCVVANLDSTVALAAAEASLHHRLSTADAIIYATADLHGADLLTCDAHFRDLPGVIYVPKSKG